MTHGVTPCQELNKNKLDIRRLRPSRAAMAHFARFSLLPSYVADSVLSSKTRGKGIGFGLVNIFWKRMVAKQVTFPSLATLAKELNCSVSYLSELLSEYQRQGWLYKDHFYNNSNSYWLHPQFNDGPMWFELRHVFKGLKRLSLSLLLSTCGYGAEENIHLLRMYYSNPASVQRFLNKEKFTCTDPKLSIKQCINFSYFFNSMVGRGVPETVCSDGKYSTSGVQAHEVDQIGTRIEQVMKELVAGAKECNTVGFYHQLQKIERPGVINYKSIPQVEKILKKIDVEQYRGKSTVFWQLKTI